MGFSPVDYGIVILYLLGITAFGILVSGSRDTVRDYFLGTNNIHWLIICLSIVAAETSTLTLIGVPALAFSNFARPEEGGNLTYLQMVIGYIIGRLIISFILIPAYFKGKLMTAYELLQPKFGARTKYITAFTFLIMRALGQGVRVFAASIVLSAILSASLPEVPYLWIWSIIVVGSLTLIYIYKGGVTPVIWTDLVQLIIYIVGAFLAVYQLLSLVPGGWSTVVDKAILHNKLQVFSFSTDLALPYTFWAGVFGGAFLTMASHGTDQLIIQRLLACRNKSDSQKALIVSSLIVLLQVALFLFIGISLFVYYEIYPLSTQLQNNDEIFPVFIVQRLPHGISGFVIASILAAAMSNLSASLNSLSSTTLLDIYKPLVNPLGDERELLRLSRRFTVAWTFLLVCIAVMARNWGSVFTVGLTIASLLYGPMLGTFLLAVLTKRTNELGVITGLIVSIVFILLIKFYTNVAWTWYVLMGTTISLISGYAVSLFYATTHKDTKSTGEST